MLQFDFSVVDWSEDTSPYDQCWGEAPQSEQSSVSSSSSDQRATLVRFAPTAQVHEIPHFKDYSIEEINATWFQSEEMVEMRNRMRQDAIRIEQGEDGECETLGLERFTVEGMRSRNAQVRAAYDAVLREQSRQWWERRIDPDSIAAEYQAAMFLHSCSKSQEYNNQWVEILL